jgi:uridine kinase
MPLHFSEAGTFARQIRFSAATADRPYLIALDGRSGVGKSSLAAVIASNVGAAIIDGDDLFAGGTALRSDNPAVRAADCIDWNLPARGAGRLAAGARCQLGRVRLGRF